MTITLNDKDIQTIDALIKKTPFEFAYPFYQFFTNKITTEQKNEADRKSLDSAAAAVKQAPMASETADGSAKKRSVDDKY